MPLSADVSMLDAARSQARAIIGFNIYNLEQGIGVIRAAETVGTPVLLQAGSNAFAYAGREPLARMAVGLAKAARVPVGVHLDHCRDLVEIEACLQLGYTSVMFDGSHLPFDENVRQTAAAVELAHRHGAWVEAELAGISGDEDESAAPSERVKLTNPAAAASFVSQTNVDALAVAIGNVHGITNRPVTLDIERLASIATAVDIPLVLHGTSGLPEDQVSAAISHGVAKLNVNTELRRATRSAISQVAQDMPGGDALPPVLEVIIDGCAEAALARLRAASAIPQAASG